jgi:hypothetical protein
MSPDIPKGSGRACWSQAQAEQCGYGQGVSRDREVEVREAVEADCGKADCSRHADLILMAATDLASALSRQSEQHCSNDDDNAGDP